MTHRPLFLCVRDTSPLVCDTHSPCPDWFIHIRMMLNVPEATSLSSSHHPAFGPPQAALCPAACPEDARAHFRHPFPPFPLLRCCICTAGHVHPCTTRRLRRPPPRSHPLPTPLHYRVPIHATSTHLAPSTLSEASLPCTKGRTSTFPLAHIYPSPLSIRGTLLPRTDRLPSIQHRVASLLPIRTAHSP